MSDSRPVVSVEAETAVVAGLMYLATCHTMAEARDAVMDVRERLVADAFFYVGPRTVYEQILKLVDAERPFDGITLTQAMRDAGHGDVGGQVGTTPCGSALAYIMELCTVFASPSQLSHHVGIVLAKYIWRQLQSVCAAGLLKAAEEQDRDAAQVLDELQSQMLAISERNTAVENFKLPADGVGVAINRLQEAHENKGGISGMPSGLMDLDRLTSGWKGGQNIVVGGSTGMGKTSLMLQFAAHLALRCGDPVAFFSLEMGYDELIERLCFSEAQVSLQRARDGLLTDEALTRFMNAAKNVAESKVYTDDWPGLNVFEFRARARRAVKKFGCKAIFLDYIQLLESVEQRDDNRVQELARFSRAVKLTAKTLGVPVFVGAQLNRKPDERASQVVVNPFVKGEDGKPMSFKRYGYPQLGDLRECGAISQDADLVIFPYRPWYWSKDSHDKVTDSPMEQREWAQLVVAKHRNGPVGPVAVHFVADETRFATHPDENGNARATMYSTVKAAQQAGFVLKQRTFEEEED